MVVVFFPLFLNHHFLKISCPYYGFIYANTDVIKYNSEEYLSTYVRPTHHNETVKIPRTALMHYNSQLINCQVEFSHINKSPRTVWFISYWRWCNLKVLSDCEWRLLSDGLKTMILKQNNNRINNTCTHSASLSFITFLDEKTLYI